MSIPVDPVEGAGKVAEPVAQPAVMRRGWVIDTAPLRKWA